MSESPSQLLRETPEELVATAVSAQTLTVSDQHATILLTHQSVQQQEQSGSIDDGGGGDGDEREAVVTKDGDTAAADGKSVSTLSAASTTRKSILKVTLVPFHREVFDVPPKNGVNNAPSSSSAALSFLSSYRFSLTSESGAEYSYYDAQPRHGDGSDSGEITLPAAKRISSGEITLPTATCIRGTPPGSFKVELISPASERQISRCMPKPSSTLIEETPDIYERITRPYIQSIVNGTSLNWIQHIVEKRKEVERLLLDDDEFILNIDTKWRSHPDPAATNREGWFEHASTSDLYCLAILKEKGIATLRDLRSHHLVLLRRMVEDGKRTIESVYGVPRDQLRVFVHYHPQFYHFHVHYTRLENEGGCQVERGHLVSDIIQNLESDSDFYSKRTLTFKMPVNNALCMAIMADRKEQKDG